MSKPFDIQERLIAFAGDMVLFIRKLDQNMIGNYLINQILRSSGSAALNYAESQSASSDKDYINKVAIALKELRETEVNLKIMKHISIGGDMRQTLINENIELIKILSTLIKNRKVKSNKT